MIPSLLTPPSQSCPNRFVTERKLISLLNHETKNFSKSDTCLDLGCGQAEFRFLFEMNGYIGVDIHDFDFEKKQAANVQLIVEAAQNLHLSTKLSLAFSHYALHYFENPIGVLTRVREALCNNSKLIFSVPSAWVLLYEWPNLLLSLVGKRIWVSSSGGATYRSTAEMLKMLRSAGFDEVEVVQGCGPLIGMAKFVYIILSALSIIPMIGRYLWDRLRFGDEEARRKFVTRCHAFTFLPVRKVGLAITMKDFLNYWHEETAKMGVLQSAYHTLLLILDSIDRSVWPRLMVEKIFIARKSSPPK